MTPGVNYVTYSCSSAGTPPEASLDRSLTLEKNIIAVITQNRVRDDKFGRQIKKRTLYTRRLFLLT